MVDMEVEFDVAGTPTHTNTHVHVHKHAPRHKVSGGELIWFTLRIVIIYFKQVHITFHVGNYVYAHIPRLLRANTCITCIHAHTHVYLQVC